MKDRALLLSSARLTYRKKTQLSSSISIHLTHAVRIWIRHFLCESVWQENVFPNEKTPTSVILHRNSRLTEASRTVPCDYQPYSTQRLKIISTAKLTGFVKIKSRATINIATAANQVLRSVRDVVLVDDTAYRRNGIASFVPYGDGRIRH